MGGTAGSRSRSSSGRNYGGGGGKNALFEMRKNMGKNRQKYQQGELQLCLHTPKLPLPKNIKIFCIKSFQVPRPALACATT